MTDCNPHSIAFPHPPIILILASNAHSKSLSPMSFCAQQSRVAESRPTAASIRSAREACLAPTRSCNVRAVLKIGDGILIFTCLKRVPVRGARWIGHRQGNCEPVIEIRNLTRKFDQVVAVDDLSFEVREGEVLGFLGPNGAGKSTTMKIITGFLSPSAGSVTIDGFDIGSQPLEAKALIGYLPEGAPCYGDMTTLEFLRFIARIRGYRGEAAEARIAGVMEDVALGSVARQTIETLSKGFKRRVGLAQAILHDPKVLILDEPTDGLDPNQKNQVRELIRNLARDKIVIVSTHILEEVTAVCTRAIIIDQGRIVADGAPGELEARSRYHQAVELRLAGELDLATELADVAEIAGVEKNPADNASFTILSRGKPIFAQVSQFAQQRQWPVEEFHVRRGQLEDVFRMVTSDTSGTGASADTAAAANH